MAFIALPGGIRVAMEFNLVDKVVVNIYHVTTTDPIVTIKLAVIAQAFADWWLFDQAERFSHNIALVKVTAHDLSIPNGEKHEEVISPPEAGGITEGPVPNNVALVASLLTVKTGRSFQGRSYLAGLAKSGVTHNSISATKSANIVANFVQLDAALAAIATQLVVASFVSEGAPRTTALGTPVTGVAVKLRVDTQRRRLPVE